MIVQILSLEFPCVLKSSIAFTTTYLSIKVTISWNKSKTESIIKENCWKIRINHELETGDAHSPKFNNGDQGSNAEPLAPQAKSF